MRNYSQRMPDLRQLLHTTFGFAGFRANQEAVCRAATDGKDVLLVMPTGAGKSLCYQLPAIARGGTALVISPLIALMDDQAHKLTAAGLKVARIHSGLSRDDSRQACRDYLDGRLQFLFIAPERMRVPGFPEMLARRKPALIAIDEAHCISAWGHDFRPDYRTLGEHLPALRPSPIIALTATATPQVQRDIVTQLNLQQPALFIHGFRRENLAIEAVELSKPRRAEFVTTFLADRANRPAIVYAPSRATADELAQTLGRKFPAAAYHAGLPAEVRENVQRRFQSGKLEVVVATIAFGMGIDKADVRSVVHFALPASVEAFYQEIGRAGRDGLPARTVLLHSFVDRKIHETFLERDYPGVADLLKVSKCLTDEFLMPDYIASRLKMDRGNVQKSLEKLASQGAAQFDMGGNVRLGSSTDWQTGYQQQVAFRRAQIDAMAAFAETPQCRMTSLIRHFGDLADAHRPCGHCDFCAPSATSAQPFAEPTAAQEKDLRAILRGLDGMSKATGRLHTDLAPSLKSASDRKAFDALLDGLARAGLLTLVSETFTNPEGALIPYRKAALTHEGRTLASSEPLNVLLRAEAQDPKVAKRKADKSRVAARADIAASFNPQQTDLAERLKVWRKEEAASNGRPAFFVLTDALLLQIASERPQTLSQLQQISGMGEKKVDSYGSAIIAICRGESKPKSPQPLVPHSSQPHRDEWVPPKVKDRPGPTLQLVEKTPTYQRDRPAPPEPEAALNPDQQALDLRLRAWRKAEAEKLGLPQFFVLGTSTLRSIVLIRPRSLSQLQTINGIGPEKLDRFGSSIVELCSL